MSWASKVAESDPSRGGVYPEPGVYPVIQIDVLKMIKSRAVEDLFIGEIDILKSNVESRPAGSSMTWMCNLTKHDAAPGNVKAFLAALAGVDDTEIDVAGAEMAVSDQNPMQGMIIRLEASVIQTRAKTDFTLCRWSNLNEEMQAKAAELRAAAGFPPF